MSFDDGWSAINLDMPKRVPRTEYSAEFHWDLIKAVTGINVNFQSSDELKQSASAVFIRAWNYDFIWNVCVSSREYGEIKTDMGHAEYAAGGVDRSDTIYCPFSSPEDVLDFDPSNNYGA